MNLVNKTKIKFSYHALNRADEIGLSCAELVKAWFRATGYELSAKEKAYKFKVYGMESLDDSYAYDAVTKTIFTLHSSGQSTDLVIITVTKKGLNL
jgi:hypothetical protein